MYNMILAFISSFTLTFLAIPSIISVAKKKNLFDEPGDRRSHTVSTPSLGGIAIFAGTVFSIILWTPFAQDFGKLQYILCAFIIIFLIGAKDDIDPISPSKKLMGQVFAAGILVFNADIHITSLYGILGIYELHDWVSYGLSVFTILVIINAFNLIDGINGLSASIGTLITLTMGFWFFKVDHPEIAIVAYSLAGALIAFLKYNITPAKIFMGDTGSLLLGLVCSVLAIKFIDSGLTHMQATCLLVMVNLFFIFMVVTLHEIGTLRLLILILGVAILLSTTLYFISKNKAPRKKDK